MDTLAIANEELTALDRSIADKMAEVARLQQRRDKLRAYLTLSGELFGQAVGQVQLEGLQPEVVASQRSSSSMSVVMLTEAVIKELGQMHTRQLMPKLEERGIVIAARDKLAALSAILSKSEKFQSDRRHGWSLKGETPSASRAPGVSSATMAV